MALKSEIPDFPVLLGILQQCLPSLLSKSLLTSFHELEAIKTVAFSAKIWDIPFLFSDHQIQSMFRIRKKKKCMQFLL